MSSWKDNVRKVEPYVPGEQPKIKNVIKLNTNENPYPPSPKVEEIIKNADCSLLRKYPDPACSELVNELSKTYGVDPDMIFVGVGSDDVLATCFMTFFCSDKPVLFPDVTYSFYDVWAELFNIPYERVPLDGNFNINTADYKRENGGIIFPNPNAPTGIALELSDIEKIVKANKDSVVIVDEAYVDFGTRSALELLDRYENLLVVQTFSKSRSLAGLRIGFAIGHKEMISYLWAVRNSFNSYTLNSFATAAGAAALRDKEYFEKTVNDIINTRERSKKRFKELGFEFGDSKANFIFVKHPMISAKELFSKLKENNIFVRYFNKERIDDHLRITIGTDEEMDRLFEFLENKLRR